MSGQFPLHRQIAALVDWCSCEFINLLHKRTVHESTTLQDLQQMRREISGMTPQEFYAHGKIASDYHPRQGSMRLRFTSPIPSGIAENDTLVCDFFPAGPTWDQPLMFLLHGLMSVSDLGYRRWASRMNKYGWHVIFVHLPYHYERTPKGSWSGELTLGPNGRRNIAAFRQAVTDVRALALWVRSRGVPRWGVLGMSYGGWVGAVLATLEAEASPCLLIEPPVDFQHATWESPASRTIRSNLRQNGLSPDLVRDVDALVSPMALKPAGDPKRVTLYAGEFDRICPPQMIQQLAERWGCGYKIFPQGHVGYRLMREAFADWTRQVSHSADL